MRKSSNMGKSNLTMYKKKYKHSQVEFIAGMKGSLVAQTVKRLSTMRETRFDPWLGEIPWRRKWQSTPVLLPGKSHGQRSLVGYFIAPTMENRMEIL